MHVYTLESAARAERRREARKSSSSPLVSAVPMHSTSISSSPESRAEINGWNPERAPGVAEVLEMYLNSEVESSPLREVGAEGRILLRNTVQYRYLYMYGCMITYFYKYMHVYHISMRNIESS
jgi:hypothetical protein